MSLDVQINIKLNSSKAKSFDVIVDKIQFAVLMNKLFQYHVILLINFQLSMYLDVQINIKFNSSKVLSVLYYRSIDFNFNVQLADVF